MSSLDIHLSNCQVALDHVQGGMSKDSLQGIDITTIAQEVDGKGVAESVDGGILDTCSFSLSWVNPFAFLAFFKRSMLIILSV